MSDALRAQLQRVYEERGELTPGTVLDSARPETSPLYGRFEWDNNIAGERYRLQQAHELIQSVKVVYRQAEGNRRERSVRAFHALPSSTGYVYKPVEEVAADEFSTQVLLAEMRRAWNDLRRRFEMFDEFWKLVREESEVA